MLQPFTQSYINKPSILHSAAFFVQISIYTQNREWSSRDVGVSCKVWPYQEDIISKLLFKVCLSTCNDKPLSVETTEPGGIYGMSLSCCLHTSCLGRFLLSILSHKSNVYGERTPTPSSRQDNSLLSCTVDLHTPTTPLCFQWICFGFFAKQVRRWLLASQCLSEYPASWIRVIPTSGNFKKFCI